MIPDNTNNPNQQQDVIAEYANSVQQLENEANERTIRKARNALYWAGGLVVFWEMYAMIRSGSGFDPVSVGFAVIMGGTFVALAIWTKSKPYTAIITGLIVFIGYLLLVIAAHVLIIGRVGLLRGIFGGFIIKVIILINLILPIKAAKELQQARGRRY